MSLSQDPRVFVDDDMSRLRSKDWMKLIIGLVLFATPWLYGFTSNGPASMSAWISGIIVAATSALALRHFAEWEEWVDLALGGWLIAAPFVLGFTGQSMPEQAHFIGGALIAGLAIWEIWIARHMGRGPIPISR
jgi:hypothetical protein